MKRKLKIAFDDYTNLVKSRLTKSPHKGMDNIYKIHFNDIYEINNIIFELENNDIFNDLISITSETYHSRGNSLEKEEWIDIVQTFFRRSYFYYNCYNNLDINTINFFVEYQKALERDIVELSFIAPLGYVDISSNYIEFNQFKIIKLREDELERITNNKIRVYFYPNVYLDNNYITQLLSNHCILFSMPYEVKGLRGVDYNSLYYGIPGNINDYEEYLRKWVKDAEELKYINYPKHLLPILQKLCLFDWENNTNQTGRGGKFFIPFVIISDDDLISSPYGRGGLWGGVMRPQNSPNFFVHTYEAENILFGIDLNENKFKSFINDIDRVINEINIEENKIEFLELSLNSYVKSFFSEGLEELLWQMISMEALVGDKGDSQEGLMKRIGQRILFTLSENDKDGKEIKRDFVELYKFRSSLVHGTKIKNTIYLSNLKKGRNLARKILLWFLYFLAYLRKESRGSDLKITKEDILAIIDFSRHTEKKFNEIFSILPSNFPHI